ncbi:MAG: hypothetical protein V1885_03105 [Candidatus Brennerbacteria bacterium]
MLEYLYSPIAAIILGIAIFAISMIMLIRSHQVPAKKERKIPKDIRATIAEALAQYISRDTEGRSYIRMHLNAGTLDLHWLAIRVGVYILKAPSKLGYQDLFDQVLKMYAEDLAVIYATEEANQRSERQLLQHRNVLLREEIEVWDLIGKQDLSNQIEERESAFWALHGALEASGFKVWPSFKFYLTLKWQEHIPLPNLDDIP